jgi:hypothetical protein
MSATFTAAAKALTNDPELSAKMKTAGSAEERVALFKAAGVTVPTHADVNSHLANMTGVAGGMSSQDQTDVEGAAVVTATAAGAGAA